MTASQEAPPGPHVRLRLLLEDGMRLVKEAELEMQRAMSRGSRSNQAIVDYLPESPPVGESDEISDLAAQALYRRLRQAFPGAMPHSVANWKPWAQMSDMERAWFRGVSQECQKLRRDPPYLAAIRAAHNYLTQHFSGQDPAPMEAAHTWPWQAWERLDQIIHPDRYRSA